MSNLSDKNLEYDVAVIGGGSAGLCAAVAAANNGAKTILVEGTGGIAGDLTSGLPIDGCRSTCGEWIIGGVPRELFDECDKYGGYVGSIFDKRSLWVVMLNPRVAGFAALRILRKAGVDLLPYTQLFDVNRESGVIKSVTALNKGKKINIKAKVYIDCTGDGDLGALAGLPFEFGSETGETQPVSIVFQMRNVCSEKLMEFVRDNADSLGLGENPLNNKSGEELAMELYEAGVPKIFFSGEGKMLQKAMSDGSMYQCSMLTVTPNSKDFSCVTINSTRVVLKDPTDGMELGKAMYDLSEQTDMAVRFLIENVPGFENSYFDGSSPRLGVRETRRIIGEEILCVDDVMHAVKREDGVAKGGHEVDIHGEGQKHTRRAIDDGGSYDIPYKCLIPKGMDNMLIAGRCVSADRGAHSSARVMGTCMAMGQAAGTSAAICVKENISVRDVDVNKLRTVLKEQGSVIDGTR